MAIRVYNRYFYRVTPRVAEDLIVAFRCSVLGDESERHDFEVSAAPFSVNVA